MTKTTIRRITVALAAMALAGAAHAVAVVGQPAPAFSAVDTSGRTVTLAELKGRHVVLEWVNPDCAFVKKHYGSANMQGTQADATAKGVVWLAVNSTRADHPEYRAPAAMAEWMSKQRAAPTATLIDADGKVGRAYGARTTPHLYVIDPAGTLVYAGAIDDKRSANPDDVKTAKNHVKAALAETLAGKPVSTAATQPYGCSVKY